MSKVFKGIACAVGTVVIAGVALVALDHYGILGTKDKKDVKEETKFIEIN